MNKRPPTTAAGKRLEQAAGVRYGCHLDLDEGEAPDACVKDWGEDRSCDLAKHHRSREGCKWWRRVEGNWEDQLLAYLEASFSADSAHDLGHLKRVLASSRRIAAEEGAHDADILTAAALLHDVVALPKNHPERDRASRLAAEKAVSILTDLGFPSEKLSGVAHAVEAHSFSAGIPPMTPEARALQDADRLDALGAIGIARCFAVSGSLGRALFHPTDPLAAHRDLDETTWALDHFQTKLLRFPQTMTTAAGRAMAADRASVVEAFMRQLALETGA